MVTSGYRAAAGGDTLYETEYLKLILQYLSQARELEQFAGANQTIDVPTCESRETAQLLKLLGFRLRNECGPEAILETVNPSRAFLSIDSGFPLADIEVAFREGRAFASPTSRPTCPPPSGRTTGWASPAARPRATSSRPCCAVPTWRASTSRSRKCISPQPSPCGRTPPANGCSTSRMCWTSSAACSRRATAKPFCPAVPAPRTVWEKLVGVSPDQGAEFFSKLAEIDDGWMGLLLRFARTRERRRGRLLQRAKQIGAVLHGRARSSDQPRPGTTRLSR